MMVARYLRTLSANAGEPRDLTEEQAHGVLAAMLDGGVPELELGACLMALRIKTESAAELLGFHRAASERLFALKPPATGVRPVVFAADGGAIQEPNLLPLLAFLLRRIGIPVLVHGTLEGAGRVATAYILRELGVLPSGTLAHAQQSLDEDLLAFVPTGVLCPGVANLLALRSRLGVRNAAHAVVKLLDPFRGTGLRVIGAADPQWLAKMETVLRLGAADALLLKGTEGES
jgi:anthranilate phosphoribosyltransferase